MGLNLTLVKKFERKKQDLKFRANTISKIKECYSKSKSSINKMISDTSNFHEVFNESEIIFDCFCSSDKTLNCFEFIIGLTIFARNDFYDKSRFLFDIFNMNDLNSLSFLEVELILFLALKFVFKIFRIEDEPIREDIKKVLLEFFKLDKRINYSSFLNFLFESIEVSQFFFEIEQEGPNSNFNNQNKNAINNKFEKNEIPQYLNDYFKLKKCENTPEFLLKNKKSQIVSQTISFKNRNLFAFDFSKDFIDFQDKNFKIKETNLDINWVYGFRCSDIANSFEFHMSDSRNPIEFSLNKKIIYFTSNIVVIFYYKINKQKHYKKHKNIVSALTLSSNNQICASGEEGYETSIHIWEINTLETLIIVPFFPSIDIYLLMFSKNDEFIFVTGKRKKSPLRIYNTKNGQIVLSLNFDFFIFGLVCLKSFFGDFGISHKPSENLEKSKIGSSFVAFSVDHIIMFEYSKKKQIYQYYIFNLPISSKSSLNRISSCLLLYHHEENPKMEIYGSKQKFGSYIYAACESGKFYQISKLKKNETYFREVYDFKKPITHLIHYSDQCHLIVLQNTIIEVFDMVENFILQTIDINFLPISLKINQIKNIKLGFKEKLFFSTIKGDIVQVNLSKKIVYSETEKTCKTFVKKIENVIKFSSEIVNFCLIEQSNENDKVLFIVDSDSYLYGFLCSDHSIFLNKYMGSKITAIAGIVNPKGGYLLTIGNEKGSVFVQNNLEEFSKKMECGSKINCLEISEDLKYLIVGVNSGQVLIFISSEEEIFESLSMKSCLVTGVPIQINIMISLESFLVQTNEQKFYIFDVKGNIEELKNKKLIDKKDIKDIDQQEKFNAENFKLIFNSGLKNQNLFILIDVDLGIVCCGEDCGSLSIFEEFEKLKLDSPSSFTLLSNKIIKLELSKDKKKIFHFCEDSSTFCESKLKIKFESFQKPIQNYLNHTKTNPNLSFMQFDKQNSKGFEKKSSQDEFIDKGFVDFASNLKDTSPQHISKNISKIDDTQITYKNYKEIIDQTTNQIIWQNFPTSFDKLLKVYQFHLKLKESMIFISGFSHPFLNLIYKNSESSSQLNSNFLNENDKTTININYIYGIELSFVKNPVFYLHNYFDKKIENKTINLFRQQKIDSIKNKKKEFNEICNSEIFKEFYKESNVFQFIEDNSNHVNREYIQNSSIDDFRYSKQNEKNESNITAQNGKEFDVTESVKRNYIGRDVCITQCGSTFVYIVSRFIIVADSGIPNIQKIYKNHNFKVSSISVDHKRQLIASSEFVSYSSIHIWSWKSLQQLALIDTRHLNQISLIEFTSDGNNVISISNEKTISIQISCIKSESEIAFKNYFCFPITILLPDTYDSFVFYTGSKKTIDIWRFENNSIIHKRKFIFEELKNDFVLDFKVLNVNYENFNETHFVVTTSSGKLILQKKNRILKIEKTNNKSPIVVLKLLQIENSIIFIIADEDCFIRFYNQSLVLLNEFLVSPEKKSNKQKSVIKSLDLNICDLRCDSLVAFDSGYIMDIEFTILKKEDLNNKVPIFTFQIKKKNTVCRFHKSISTSFFDSSKPLRNNLCFDIDENWNLMISSGSDNTLLAWDTHNKNFVGEKIMESSIKSIKISKIYNLVYVGLQNSLIHVIKIDMKFAHFKESGERGLVFEFKNTVIILNDDKIMTPIVSMVLSESNKKLAVSYGLNQDDSEKEESQGNSVLIIVFSFDEKSMRNDKKIIFHKRDYRYSFNFAFENLRLRRLQKSCNFMQFSNQEYHLLVYYQFLNDQGKIQNGDKEGEYVVWDLATGVFDLDPKNFKNFFEERFCFPTHISSKENLLKVKDFFLEKMTGGQTSAICDVFKNDIFFSAITDSNKNLVFLGTTDGCISITNKDYFFNKINFDNSKMKQITTSNISDDSQNESSNPKSLSKNNLKEINQIEDLKKIFQAKRFFAHSSSIKCLKYDPISSTLLSSGFADNCLIEWKITSFDNESEGNLTSVDITLKDDFLYEIPSQETIKYDFLEIILKRKQLTNILATVDLPKTPDFFLKFSKIIGRSAFNNRFNLGFTRNHELVYSAGTLILSIDISEKLACFESKSETNTRILKKRDWMKEGKDFENIQNSLQINSISNQVFIQERKSFDKKKEKNRNFLDFGLKSNNNVSSFYQSESENSISLKKTKNESIKLIDKIQKAKQNKNQKVIISEPESNLKPPFEISCFEIANDYRTICIGTKNGNSILYFWDLTSQSYLYQIKLEGCYMPYIIRFSNDSKFLVCFGLTIDRIPSIYYICVQKLKIESFCCLRFSLPFIIKDVSFLPVKNNEFITVGINHISRWTSFNGLLNCNPINLENQNTFFEVNLRKRNKNQEKKNQNTKFNGFLVIRFLFENVAVIGSCSGLIHLFNENKIIFKKQCFQKGPVSVITVSPFIKGDFIIAGFGCSMFYFRSIITNNSFTGVMCLFEIKYFEDYLSDSQKIKNHIQSLIYVDSDLLVYGSRNGDLGLIKIEESSLGSQNSNEDDIIDADDPTPIINKSNIAKSFSLFYEFYDNEIINIVDLSNDDNFIYCLTKNGLFKIYDTKTLKCILSKSFKRKSVDLVVLDEAAILVFERDLITLDTENEFCEVQNYNIQTTSDIHKVRLNSKRNRIAIATKPGSDIQPMIKVYNIADCFELVFTFYCQEIELLDFSIENSLLFFQDKERNMFLYDLNDEHEVCVDLSNINKLSWLTDGFLIKENLVSNGIDYEKRENIVNIIQLDETNLIVTDIYGSVL